jgi:5'-nucleotidase / UDP-sugar diphosphatase
MGRETKYLLALLGLLAGVFFGVVSLKLFVPRPPAGAGPDVHGDIATTEAQALVEPPELSPPPALADSGATARPPLAVDAADFDDQESAAPLSRFGDGAADAARDPFVVAASYETPDQPDLLPPPAAPTEPPPAPPVEVATLPEPPPRADLQPPVELLPPPTALGETHVAQAGDSWWSLAERAYGDGRLYRALFAWNRMLDPRVSLAPGTRLEIPPAAKLGASWPGLMPRD